MNVFCRHIRCILSYFYIMFVQFKVIFMIYTLGKNFLYFMASNYSPSKLNALKYPHHTILYRVYKIIIGCTVVFRCMFMFTLFQSCIKLHDAAEGFLLNQNIISQNYSQTLVFTLNYIFPFLAKKLYVESGLRYSQNMAPKNC